MKAAAGEGYATATDLADWLVRILEDPVSRGAPYYRPDCGGGRESGVPLDRLPLAEMQRVEPRITKDVFGVLSVERSVRSRKSYGGTAAGKRGARSQKMAATAWQDSPVTMPCCGLATVRGC